MDSELWWKTENKFSKKYPELIQEFDVLKVPEQVIIISANKIAEGVDACSELCTRAEEGDDTLFWSRYWAGYRKALESLLPNKEQDEEDQNILTVREIQ